MRITHFIFLLFFFKLFCSAQGPETLQSRQDTSGFYKINDPFYVVNFKTLIDFNFKEYSKIYYKTLIKSKNTKRVFVDGFIWRVNKEKKIIIEYVLKNDDHLTKYYKIDRPTFIDTIYYIQLNNGEFLPIADTVNLSIKIDSINKNSTFKHPTGSSDMVKTLDKENRLMKYRFRYNVTRYDYDINNNLTKELHSVINTDSVEVVYDEIRYEYLDNKLSKMKYYSNLRYPYLIDGLYKIAEYKYDNIVFKPNEVASKTVRVSTIQYEKIEGNFKTKKKYNDIIGSEKQMNIIHWSNKGRTTTRKYSGRIDSEVEEFK
jgi:hypothetical protein